MSTEKAAGATEAAGKRLAPFMSPVGAWSYGIGTAIGWGSLVVTTSQYLLKAGVVGSVLGIVVGTLVMVCIAYNYACLMNRYPDAGGSYTFVRHVFGHDHGFLLAWFLALAYLAVFWANATSLPLFSRFFLGSFFKVGYLYTIFDYEVYLGEVLLTMGAVALVGLLCVGSKRVKQYLMIGLAIVFTVGIAVCFGSAMMGHGSTGRDFKPEFLINSSLISQVLGVTFMTPWAFIGFESISHSTEEFSFSRTKSFRVLLSVVITTALLYLMITVLSATAYPDRYTSWFAYLSDLGNCEGLEGLPPFYAAYRYLGDAGVVVLMLALLALVITSLIGNVVALSRLFVALGRDGVVPERLSNLNKKGTPQSAILCIVAISILIPFLGRTPIGWIVDITTISAVIVYGFVSAAELKVGRTENNRLKIFTGFLGTSTMVILGVATVLPSLISTGELARETYLIVTVWALLGFVYFRYTLSHDKNQSFGKSVVVWVFLVALVLFSSAVWMQKSDQQRTAEAINESVDFVRKYPGYDSDFVSEKIKEVERSSVMSSLVMVGLSALAMSMMLNNYRFMRRRQEQSERELGKAREAAYRDPLTGVKSKNAFVEHEMELDARIADGEEVEFSIIVCDVNGLKYVNDTQGHKAGDEYIRNACRTVCRHFKHSPVYRIGGDEFVVLPQGEDLQNMERIIEEFDTEIEGYIGTSDAVVSAGCSDFRPGRDRRFHDVFERADSRMYQRKMQLKGMGAATRD